MMIPNRIRAAGMACLVLLVLVPLSAGANTWPVEPGESIGAALDAAAAGDTVLVACGEYQEQGLVLPDRVVLLAETGEQDCVTILSAGGVSVLTCAAPGDFSKVVGITFAPNDPFDPVERGAGVVCVGSSPVFERCRFVDLVATYGGAVFVENAYPSFMACEFENNRARTSGGAMACVTYSNPSLSACLLVGNRAGVTGSAVNAAIGSTPAVDGCTLVGNEGAALAGWDRSTAYADHAIFTGGGTAFLGDEESIPRFICSDIWGNEGGDWIGPIADQAGWSGNLALDPLFCPPGTATLAYSLVDISPCAAEQNESCGRIGARDVGCDETVGIGEQPPDDGPAPPLATRLHPSFPNPFNPRITVRFELRRDGPVRIGIYDTAGRLVRRLLDEHRPAGTHEVPWQGRNRKGRQVAAGVYFIRLESEDLVLTHRVTLVK